MKPPKVKDLTLRRADWSADQQALSALRREVFIEEQGVSEAEEWDGRDATAWHLCVEDAQGQCVGTGRLLDEGTTAAGRGARIGRMAVRKAWRGHGVGAMLMHQFLRWSAELGFAQLVLDAQVHAIDFYQKFDFVVVSEIFLDAGIEHKKMRRDLTPAGL